MPEKAIIADPIRDIIMTVVSLDLGVVYRARIMMMPDEVSLVIKQQDLVVCQLLAVRTDEDTTFRVTARVSAEDVDDGIGESGTFVGGLREET